jgi:uroporphyrinogen-III synthase
MSRPKPPIAVLTRPEGRNEALARRLRDAGWQALVLPALLIEPLPEAAAPPMPGDFDLVVFVSGNAARLYLEQLAQYLPQGGWPAGARAATVGPASAQALRESPLWGPQATVLHPPADAQAHDSEALWNRLSQDAPPRRVLLVRGAQGRDWLANRLQEAGAQVVRHALYRRQPAVWADACVRQLQAWAGAQPPVHPVWLLTSAEGMDAVACAARGQGLFDWWRQCRFVVTHPRLAQHFLAIAGAAGQTETIKICQPSDASIFEALTVA